MNKREAQNKSYDLIDTLTKERIRQDISRTKLAKNLRMSTTTISKIEEHEQLPKLSTLILIANFLDAEIEVKLKSNVKVNKYNP